MDDVDDNSLDFDVSVVRTFSMPESAPAVKTNAPISLSWANMTPGSDKSIASTGTYDLAAVVGGSKFLP